RAGQGRSAALAWNRLSRLRLSGGAKPQAARLTHGGSHMAPSRIAVLGAGPVGLEAALYAATLGLPVTVFDAGRVGEHLRQWGHVRLFSPFGLNSTPLGRNRLKTDHPGHELPADNALLT